MSKTNVSKELILDNKLHNTRLLLRKYRDIVWRLELSVQHLKSEFKAEYGDSIEDYLDTIYLAGAELSGTRLEYHSKCIDRSHKMIKLIDQAVGILRSKHKFGETYYWILHYTFLSQQQLSCIDEIMENLVPHVNLVSKRAYHRKCNEAINELGSVLWAYTSTDCMAILDEFVPEN